MDVNHCCPLRGIGVENGEWDVGEQELEYRQPSVEGGLEEVEAAVPAECSV